MKTWSSTYSGQRCRLKGGMPGNRCWRLCLGTCPRKTRMDSHTCNISLNGREKLLTFPPVPLRFFHPPAIPSLLPCSPNLSLSPPLSLPPSLSTVYCQICCQTRTCRIFQRGPFLGHAPLIRTPTHRYRHALSPSVALSLHKLLGLDLPSSDCGPLFLRPCQSR